MAKPAPNIVATPVDHVATSVEPRAVESPGERHERLQPALCAQIGSVSFSWQPLGFTVGQVALKGLRELQQSDAPSVPQSAEEGAIAAAAGISPEAGCAEVVEEMETAVVLASVEPETHEAVQPVHAEDVSEAIEAADLDLGYLALYQDEIPFHFTRRPAAAGEGRGPEQVHTAESPKAIQPEAVGQDGTAPVAAGQQPETCRKPGPGVSCGDVTGRKRRAHRGGGRTAASSNRGFQRRRCGRTVQEEGAEELVEDDVELPPFLEGIEPDEDPHETFASDNTLEPVADRLPEETSETEEDVLSAVPSAEIIPLFRPEPTPVQAWSYQFPEIGFLAEPPEPDGTILTEDVLEEAAGRLEKVIRDFGVRGEVIHVHPGPVVTLYEFEPAPGIKSSRVIALTEDIARSMSAVSARVAVIPGRNAIGIELPNQLRETVYLREILESEEFKTSQHKMPLCLGKTIGGKAVIADLARMPHLLMAGTTGSGKSVAVNTMILSLLYRFTPEQCRLIMVDPKMLELSVYDGIPHLLTPVVTDPKKAIIALRWAVREMEDRYKKMAKLGVRNIDGFNARITEAREKGEVITRSVQTGFDKETGQPVYTEEAMDLASLPYIVVIVDEMADLMMVAGKEIEGAIQRLAQMARAAGIHVILATQRPSVDVITGTIKANFPTRISFQVTSKIDSRTILGEMGAEQLLGQGDMLHMVGGGRIERVHGPFCSDTEVERVVAHLKRQAKPIYLEAVTADDDEDDEIEETPVPDDEEMGLDGADLYDQAVSIVLRHKKASTSYIQRRLQIGYNRAASLMERMEKEGVVGPANHAGKRDILIGMGGADED